MILVDTSVWINFLRRGDPALAALLMGGRVLGHPWVSGELALGNISNRVTFLGLLDNLPQAGVATDTELRALIDQYHLPGRGIGYVDAQLLAATMLTAGSRLWSRDQRLAAVAAELAVAHDESSAP